MKKPTIILLAACAAVSSAWASAEPATPDEAFAELKAGNERFVSGVTKRRDLLSEAKATSAGQKPFAAVVSCIDSRTSSELVFDQGIGDIFNARLAGNIVDEDVLGSLEFATKAAGAKLIAVIGHAGCGAVIGAIEGVKMGHLTGVLEQIEPAVSAVSKDTKGGESSSANPVFVDKCIERNVRLQMNRLTEQSPILKELAGSGAIRIVGGVQDLASGRVHFLE